MSREPLVSRSIVVAFVTALIDLVVMFGVDVSAEQSAAIIGASGAVAVLVSAFWSRQVVTPVDNPRNGDGVPLVTPAEGFVRVDELLGDPDALDPVEFWDDEDLLEGVDDATASQVVEAGEEA